MGGMVGRLLLIYCCSGCQADTVASALAFHPPEPTYGMIKDEASGKYKFVLKEGVTVSPPLGVQADMVATSSRTNIPIILIRAANATKTLLYSHGNATDLGAMFPFFAALSQALKVNVCAYDYTGYGASEGGRGPTERQVYRDVEAAYAWACTTVPIANPGQDLIVYGQSVGSGPATYISCKGVGEGNQRSRETTKRPVAGLVLHSPILSGLRVLTDDRLLGCFDIFPNISIVGGVACPVMIIHGELDEEVPVTHGRRMYAAVPRNFQAKPWWVPGRGHNDVLLGNEKEYFLRLGEYLAVVEKSREASPAAGGADNPAPPPTSMQ